MFEQSYNCGGALAALPCRPLPQTNNIKCPCQKCRMKNACIGVRMMNCLKKSTAYRVTARLNCFMEQLCNRLPEEMQSERYIHYLKKFISCFVFAMILIACVVGRLSLFSARLLWSFSRMEGPTCIEKLLAIGASTILLMGLIVLKVKSVPQPTATPVAARFAVPLTAPIAERIAEPIVESIVAPIGPAIGAAIEAPIGTPIAESIAAPVAMLTAASTLNAAPERAVTRCTGKKIVPPPVALDTYFLKPPCPISDEEAREIFRRSKIYAIPTEMKQPPQLINYLKNLLTRYTSCPQPAAT